MSLGYQTPTSQDSCCTSVWRLYWKKLTSFGLRYVVWQHIFAALAEVGYGAEAREWAEVTNQVRLVEVSALSGNCCPVWRKSIPRQPPRLLESANALIQLRCQADFGGEYLDEAPLAEADALGYIANPHLRVGLLERVERNRYCVVALGRVIEAREERRLEH